MKGRERIYGKDETVFREGEEALDVFVVVQGTVELSRQGPDGPLALNVVGPLEIFGETAIFEGMVRPVTARAAERSKIRVIPRQEFKDWLAEEEDAALRVIAMLVERLQKADLALIKKAEAQVAMVATVRGGLFRSLWSWVRGRRNAWSPGPGEPALPPFLIGIAAVNNDIENAWTRALIGLLDGRQGLAARELASAVQVDPPYDQVQMSAALLKARQLLAKEEVLDLLVWGDVHEDGYSLWFTPKGLADDDRPGSFGPFFRLELPGSLDHPVGELFTLAIFAAIEPANEVQKGFQRQLLASAFHSLPHFLQSLPSQWNLEQQRAGLAVYGHAAATMAGLEGDAGLWKIAAEAYRAALLRLPRGEHGIEEALLHKHLGGVLQAASERDKDGTLLSEAVESFRNAVECLVRHNHPQEWAGAQNRFGLALYKLDLLTGQADLLKEALAAFQSALQVFTRAEAPYRWADVMHNLGQVLQVYGDQAKSPEVLERAIDACRAAIEFRTRNRVPLAWASSQNTLGTALFLLDKHRSRTEHLDEAETAFTAALEVYRQFGVARPAQIAEKNLKHVQRLKKISGVRTVAKPDWAESE